jgi:hypothetical protein
MGSHAEPEIARDGILGLRPGALVRPWVRIRSGGVPGKTLGVADALEGEGGLQFLSSPREPLAPTLLLHWI